MTKQTILHIVPTYTIKRETTPTTIIAAKVFELLHSEKPPLTYPTVKAKGLAVATLPPSVGSTMR